MTEKPDERQGRKGEQRINQTDERRTRRRTLLRAGAVSAAVGLAGCVGGDLLGGGGIENSTATVGPATTRRPPVTTRQEMTKTDCEPETISENITSDTTWDPAECPRVALDGNIKVRDGATLTIEPGVEVVARSGAKLTIKQNSTLVASGSESEPVWFYGGSGAPGYWQVIEVESANPNELSNVVVQDAGGGDWAGVWLRGGARLSVTGSSFRNNATWGLVAEDGATLESFARNVFANNGTAPIRVATTLLGALDSRSRYSADNANDRIEVVATDVDTEATWAATGAPLYLQGNHRLFAPITVENGAEFAFSEGSKLTVKPEGALDASGADGRQTVFRSATGAPGSWQTIEIESNNPDNVLENVAVRQAGGSDWAGVWLRGGARLSVSNSSFAENATWGLVAEGGAVLPEFAANEFSGNQQAPLRVATPLVGALDSDSTYVGDNANDRIEVVAQNVESEASWPATDAPFYLQGNHKLFAPITVDPGAEFRFSQGSKLTVKSNASLTADAADGDRISFVGDTESPGHWQTIEIESNNPDNVLTNVEVAYGGAGDWANIWVRGDARASVTNSLIRGSSTYGIVVEEGAAFEGSNNTYENNAAGGIDQRG